MGECVGELCDVEIVEYGEVYFERVGRIRAGGVF